MSHYNRHYTSQDRAANDRAALADIEEWLSNPRQIGRMEGIATMCRTPADVRSLNFAMSFAGVSGYPFHAFCRAHCLDAYRAWMADGDDAVQTDEEGFAID